MTLSIDPIQNEFGAKVSGIDLRKALGADPIVARMRAAYDTP